MEDLLIQRINKIMNLFEDDFLHYFLEDNDFIEKIIFFGSRMKGTENNHSDLDLIIIPCKKFLDEVNEDIDRIQTILGIHEDLSEGLKEKITLDVKLQEFFNEQEQYGWTFRTGNAIATFYSFIKGEIGTIGVLDRNKQFSFSSL